jgi:thiamine-phosphate pyrophosphorylase
VVVKVSGSSLAELARRLKRPRSATGLPRLILMTDSRRLPDPLPAVRMLPSGSAVIVREIERKRRAALVRQLRPVCRRRRIRLLVAADEVLARRADGLHLSEKLARAGARRWRLWRRPGGLVTAAAHSAGAIRRAAALGVDAVLLAPVFATASHPQARPIGPLRFARLVRTGPLPIYALGGIDEAGARRLLRSGAAGFAAIGALSGGAQAAGGSGDA